MKSPLGHSESSVPGSARAAILPRTFVESRVEGLAGRPPFLEAPELAKHNGEMFRF
jgi:hypothetical protein